MQNGLGGCGLAAQEEETKTIAAKEKTGVREVAITLLSVCSALLAAALDSPVRPFLSPCPRLCSAAFPPSEIMGLLSIIRKIKRKEKEMRILMV